MRDSTVNANSPTSATGYGVQIVNVVNNTYQLDEKALEQVLLREDVKNLPVVVVSVAGAFRGGKSFLLNFFLRYLTSPEGSRNENGEWLGPENEQLKGFSWRGGSQRHTTGILMWSEPFVATLPSGLKVAILLMDTQGTFDSSSTMRDCSTIFALSTLISSVQIYNIKENIKEDDLQHLQFFTEYGKLLKTDDRTKPFQVLEFLIRDWQFDYEHAYGHAGGEELLAIRMEETKDMPLELRELRQHIRSSFETLTCFLMPHPGRAIRKKDFTGTLSDLDVEFVDALKELVSSIFAPTNLTPKLISGETVKARDLLNYFKSYMAIFNSDTMPSPVSIAKATAKAALLSAVRDCKELYEDRMERLTSAAQPSLTKLALDDEHRKALLAAKTAFNDKKKMASKKDSDTYLVQMTQEIGDRLPQFTLMNEAKLLKTIEEATQAYKEAIHRVHGSNLLCVHPLDLEDVHNEAVEIALTMFDAKRKSVQNIPDLERQKFQKTLHHELEGLRNLNKHHNNLITSAVRFDFSTTMEALLSKYPPLDDDEFEESYNEAKRKALAAFDAKRNRSTKHEEDPYKANLLQAMATQFVRLQKINRSKNRIAFQRALDFYTNYMQKGWNPDVCCLHPDDLLKVHRDAQEQAIRLFHPHADSNEADVEIDLLKQILDSKYNALKDLNHALNELAVSEALDKYKSEMYQRCGAAWSWIFIIPMIVSMARKRRSHEESRKAALKVFHSKRRVTVSLAQDRYLDQLNKALEDAYKERY